METATENKVGYKETKLGWIPKEWEVLRFTDFSELIHGFQFRKEHFVSEGIPVIKIGSLIDSKGISLSSASYVDKESASQFEKYRLFKGDVLMALTGGTLGKVSVVQKDFGTIFQNYRVGKFVPTSLSTKEYLVHLLQSFFVQQRVKNLVNEAAQPNFGKQDFDKIWIPLPTIFEQKKIAAILSTWDKAIDKLSNIIAEKEAIKKGLMQQLLAGKKRFPGFTDEWKEVKLGDVFTIKRGGSPRPISQYITDDPNGLNWIKIGDTQNVTKYIHEVKEKIKPEGLKKTVEVFTDDFILSNSMSFGKPYIMKTNGCIHDGWLVLRSKGDLSINFMYYLLGSTQVYKKLKSMAAGSTVQNLNKDIVSSVKVVIPNKEEQEKVAAILSAADEEIEILSKELNVMTNQKRGLMQKLLTGELRVK